MKESYLTTKILKRMNSWPGCRAIKRHGGMYGSGGEPDIDACYKSISVQLEVKVGKNKPTPLQLKRIEEWRDAGAVAAVVYSIEDVDRVREECEARLKAPSPETCVPDQPWFS